MDSDRAKDGNRRRWCMFVHSELEKRTLTQGTTKKGYENLKKDKDKMVCTGQSCLREKPNAAWLLQKRQMGSAANGSLK